jgi:hypothetical protein
MLDFMKKKGSMFEPGCTTYCVVYGEGLFSKGWIIMKDGKSAMKVKDVNSYLKACNRDYRMQHKDKYQPLLFKTEEKAEEFVEKYFPFPEVDEDDICVYETSLILWEPDEEDEDDDDDDDD